MVTIRNFKEYFTEHRERIKPAFSELVMVYGEEHYDALNNVYLHILPLNDFHDLPIFAHRIVARGLDVIFKIDGLKDKHLEYYKWYDLICLYETLVSQINEVLRKEEQSC